MEDYYLLIEQAWIAKMAHLRELGRGNYNCHICGLFYLPASLHFDNHFGLPDGTLAEVHTIMVRNRVTLRGAIVMYMEVLGYRMARALSDKK